MQRVFLVRLGARNESCNQRYWIYTDERSSQIRSAPGGFDERTLALERAAQRLLHCMQRRLFFINVERTRVYVRSYPSAASSILWHICFPKRQPKSMFALARHLHMPNNPDRVIVVAGDAQDRVYPLYPLATIQHPVDHFIADGETGYAHLRTPSLSITNHNYLRRFAEFHIHATVPCSSTSLGLAAVVIVCLQLSLSPHPRVMHLRLEKVPPARRPSPAGPVRVAYIQFTFRA